MNSQVRHPAVAGRFYPANAETLTRDVRSYLSPCEQPHKIIGCVVPHAGYMYSGPVAGSVYAQIDLPRHFVILGPNHTGLGRPLAIMDHGCWETPLGLATINAALATALTKQFPLLAEDAEAHHLEHSIEVQLPFLQTLRPDFSFVPIVIGTSRLDVLMALGVTLAAAIKDFPEPVMIIASSDMNHYESDSVTRTKDHKAIEKMLALDPQGLFEVVKNQSISMCGVGPAVIMLTAATRLGAKSAKLAQYATSGDVSGDRNMVVGYAGITVE